MSKMFGNLSTAGMQEVGDRIGGGDYILDSDIYLGTIKAASVGQSKSSKARSIDLVLDIDGKEMRKSIWITNRDDQNFSEKNNVKTPLGGFTIIDELCWVTLGHGLDNADFENKTIKQYNYEKRAEENVNVPCLVALHGENVMVAIERRTVDKQAKNAQTNKYENTGETRDENEIVKFFHVPTKMTLTEARNGVETAEFHSKWLEVNKGKTRMLAKGKSEDGRSGRPAAAGNGFGGNAAPQASGNNAGGFGGGKPLFPSKS